MKWLKDWVGNLTARENALLFLLVLLVFVVFNVKLFGGS